MKGIPTMSDNQHDPIPLELTPYVVDLLTHWARLDGDLMRPAGEREATPKLREQRADCANDIVRALLHALPVLSAEGDFADALNERAEAYADYEAARLTKAN
jgi:hypothetical protein